MGMIQRNWVMAAGLITLASGPAMAQAVGGAGNHYRWTDTHGVMQLSDSLTNEAMVQGYDIVSASGVKRGHVNSMVEQAQAVKDQAAQTQADAQAAHQRAEDDRLRAAYPTEPDLIRVQQGQLASLDGQIKTAQLSVTTQQRALSERLSLATPYEAQKQPVPMTVATAIGEQQEVVRRTRAQLASLMMQRETLITRQRTQLTHYRTLLAATP